MYISRQICIQPNNTW